MDLDKVLGNIHKYQEAMDSIRNDTMDPEMDKHYREQLLEQMKDNETIMKKIDSLESGYNFLCIWVCKVVFKTL